MMLYQPAKLYHNNRRACHPQDVGVQKNHVRVVLLHIRPLLIGGSAGPCLFEKGSFVHLGKSLFVRCSAISLIYVQARMDPKGVSAAGNGPGSTLKGIWVKSSAICYGESPDDRASIVGPTRIEARCLTTAILNAGRTSGLDEKRPVDTRLSEGKLSLRMSLMIGGLAVYIGNFTDYICIREWCWCLTPTLSFPGVPLASCVSYGRLSGKSRTSNTHLLTRSFQQRRHLWTFMKCPRSSCLPYRSANSIGTYGSKVLAVEFSLKLCSGPSASTRSPCANRQLEPYPTRMM